MTTKIMDNLDIVIDIFLRSINETATEQGIELMEDAIAIAKSQFPRNCISCGIPNKATAKKVGKQYVLKMVNFG